MTAAHWLTLAASLAIALPANAQYRKTRLNEQGRALVEATPKQAKTCQTVYRWDRCHPPRPAANPLSRPDPQRRDKCIISARNVAAKKGATHFSVQAHVVTGYRCASTVPAAQQAPPETSQGEASNKARYRSLGFVPWGGACTGISELFSGECQNRRTIQEQVTCRERRARALLEGQRLYYLPKVKTRLDYDRKADAYTVHFLGVLGRLGAASDQRYLTVGPLVTARRGTATEALADAARPFAHLLVPKAELKAPGRFKRDLLVEALVRPKALHAPVANNPARIEVIEVEVVGLRAYTPDLNWGAVVVSPPSNVPHYRCRPLEPGR